MTPPLTSLSILFFVRLSLSGFCLCCHPDDEKALLQIKESLNNANDFASWKPGTDCCTWATLFCDADTNRIIELSLASSTSAVSGHIPSALGDLPYLETLIIHRNSNLTCLIPPAIGKLTRLINLDLSFNSLSGPIPSFLANLKNLNHMDLNFNRFTGTIPAEFSQFKNLLSLRLDGNKLTGPIPDTFGEFNGILPNLFLSQNRLTGSVPKSFGKLNFAQLDFSDNLLTGDASHVFGSGKILEYVDLSRNAFDFDLTKVVFPDSLRSLDLSHNKIYGSLPASLTGLKLRHFNASYNQLCGKIPVGGRLQYFEQTEYFHNRCLCGAPLPAC